MVPCLKCGKGLIMPHGRFDNSPDLVFGCHTGWRTLEELDKTTRKNAIWMIQRWEKLTADPNSSREERQMAEDDVYMAMWSLPGKSVVFDGKRYKGISRARGLSVSVTPAPEKKRKRGSSGSGDG